MLKELSSQYSHLETEVADINDLSSVQDLLNEGDILITTVGPFMRYGITALEAAISKKAHYIDSTGEPEFVRQVIQHYGERAIQAKITLLTAAAYDYVPGQCVAALAIEKSGPTANRVDVGYYGVGETLVKLSGGTIESSFHIMTEPALFWQFGQLQTDYGGTKLRHFTIRGKKRPAISVSSSETFFLPRSYPQLIHVNVYLGWFGRLSYALSQFAKLSKVIYKIPGLQKLAKKLLPYAYKSKGEGPNENERATNDSQIIATTYNSDNDELDTVVLDGVNGYTFTANMLAWVCQQFLHGKQQAVGAIGPIEAFGVEAVLQGCEESGLNLISPD